MFTETLTSVIGRFVVLQSKSESLNATIMQELYLESVPSLEPRATYFPPYTVWSQNLLLPPYLRTLATP
jgi:hypothetical protein